MQAPKLVTDLKDDEVSGKRVLVWSDFNVPLVSGHIADDFRIRRGIRTIEWLLKKNAKVIILSHLDNVELKGEALSLRPVFEHLEDQLKISFAENISEAMKLSAEMKSGEAILIENLRFDAREKANDDSLAEELAVLADFFVNDAFSVSHRVYASVVGLPAHLPSYIGILMDEEIIALSKALTPTHPSLLILGGAKFETKLPVLNKFVDIVDNIFVTGALANDFFKELGYEIGESKVNGKVDIKSLLKNKKIILPADVAVKSDGVVVIKEPKDVLKNEYIADVGPKTLENLQPLIDNAQFILWNGPLGNYEMGFHDKTVELAEMIAKSSAYSVVGGGDTTTVISHMNFEKEFDFVSTAGGAMLEFLEKGTLPGLDAIKDNKTVFL